MRFDELNRYSFKGLGPRVEGAITVDTDSTWVISPITSAKSVHDLNLTQAPIVHNIRHCGVSESRRANHVSDVPIGSQSN
jgi:hypothetical protein